MRLCEGLKRHLWRCLGAADGTTGQRSVGVAWEVASWCASSLRGYHSGPTLVRSLQHERGSRSQSTGLYGEEVLRSPEGWQRWADAAFSECESLRRQLHHYGRGGNNLSATSAVRTYDDISNTICKVSGASCEMQLARVTRVASSLARDMLRRRCWIQPTFVAPRTQTRSSGSRQKLSPTGSPTTSTS